MKTKNKTQPTMISVEEYINNINDNIARKEAKILVVIFTDSSKYDAIMWGDIFGFGTYHYKYDSGREGDSIATGFAMRKSGPTIYIMPGYQDYSEILNRLGIKYKLGKSCLYLKNLNGLNHEVLKELIQKGLKDLQKIYPIK